LHTKKSSNKLTICQTEKSTDFVGRFISVDNIGCFINRFSSPSVYALSHYCIVFSHTYITRHFDYDDDDDDDDNTNNIINRFN